MAKNDSTQNLSDLLSLADKTVLITGAGAGIGQAIAFRVSEAGGNLILLDIDAEALQNTKQILQASSKKVETFKVDIGDKTAIEEFWQNLPQSKLPDILINNAGIFPVKEFTEIDGSFLENNINVNLNSVFWMCQQFIKRRDKKGGIVVNISSIEAVVAFKSDMAHYAAAKAGVLALTRALARDYGRKGYRVNAIMPGGVNTSGTKKMFTQALKKVDLGLFKTSYDFKQRLSLGRIGEPDDIARAAIFLATDLSSYVQGACLTVDGGFLAS